MPVDESSEENIPNYSDAYYEDVASQEEIYLEEVEEELRAILIFGDQTPPRRNAKRLLSGANNDLCVVESPQEQLTHAAEELIAGDSDDPPLSEEAVAEMLRTARIPNGFPPDM